MKIKSARIRDMIVESRPRTNGRAYFFPSDETVIDNLMNRRNRPHTQYKVLLLELLKKKGLKPEKITWSQKAGCSCGCSPGFILKGLQKDIFVDVK